MRLMPQVAYQSRRRKRKRKRRIYRA